MNILITSAGTRGYLIKYFKKILRENGKIFAADCSKYAPALYNADNYFIVLPVADKNYISELFKICTYYMSQWITSSESRVYFLNYIFVSTFNQIYISGAIKSQFSN
ncbi:hypothetical protein ES708_32622 [subsurface metagenome]